MSGSHKRKPALAGAVLIWDGNERPLVEGVPVVIGSDPKSTIPVHNDEMVNPKHVTVTLGPDYVSVLTDLGVSISLIEYKGMTGQFEGEIQADEDLEFMLHRGNLDANAVRFINFRVVINDAYSD